LLIIFLRFILVHFTELIINITWKLMKVTIIH